MPLSDNRLKNLKPTKSTYRMADGDGLSIQVEPNGSKLWRFRYRIGGKEKMISMGSYPEVGLAAARKKRDEARTLLAAGGDPSAARKAERLPEVAEELPTWREVAAEFHDKLEKEGRAGRTLAKTGWLLERTYKAFGDKPIAQIGAPEVLTMLRTIEAEGKYDTSVTVRALVSRVFRYGVATGRCERDPAADLVGALISPKVKHRPALTDHKAVGHLIRAIRGYEGEPATRAGLLLAAYTALRPGEVRFLEWGDYDPKAERINIPATRMKMPRPHIVPVSRQVKEILEVMRPISGGSRLILTNWRSADRAMSDNTLNAALRTLGFDGDTHVAHGFRTTFSTLLNEAGWNRDWIERQLAHVEGNAVRRAYNAAEYIEGRTQMMQSWADILDQLADLRD